VISKIPVWLVVLLTVSACFGTVLATAAPPASSQVKTRYYSPEGLEIAGIALDGRCFVRTTVGGFTLADPAVCDELPWRPTPTTHPVKHHTRR
jgi:hypothetical protein